MTPKKKVRGKVGVKPGNQNARKHGLYAKIQPPVDRVKAIGAQEREKILDKILLDLEQEYDGKKKWEEKLQIANVIANVCIASNGCQRTVALVSGKLTILNEAIERLIAENDPRDVSTYKRTPV